MHGPTNIKFHIIRDLVYFVTGCGQLGHI